MSRNAGRCGSLLAAVLALWSAFPAPAMAETLSFNPSQLLGAGSGPWAIAVRDFNGDGINDLAWVNYQSDNIAVFLGNGDGTFRPPVTYAVGDGPTSIAVGNFNGNANGDGTTDLVVANYLSTTVTVLVSNGDGTFQPPRTFDAGISPAFVAVADFNGDYNQDLVVVNFFSTTIAVLLGNGDGTFQSPQFFGVGPNPQVVAVGDFNGDAKLDLAVVNAGAATLSVLLGNGDGTFQTARTLVVGVNPTLVAAGDFNADGKLDLVVTPYGCFGYADCPVVSQTVSVLLGNGDGTFQPPAQFPAGSGPNAVAVADLNGDGKLDLAVADYGPRTQRATTIAVLLGNGDGTFQLPQAFYAYLSPAFVAVGDFTDGGEAGLPGGY